jgi:hypothetical protein
MGPYMALIIPSSFYDIDAGLHALSFFPGFNVQEIKHLRSRAPEKYVTRFFK